MAVLVQDVFLHERQEYGELETDSVVLAFASEEGARNNVGDFERNSLANRLSVGLEIAFSAEDVNKAYEQAVNAGARSLNQPVWSKFARVTLGNNSSSYTRLTFMH